MKNVISFLFLSLAFACSTIHRPTKESKIEHSGYSVPLSKENVLMHIKSWPDPSRQMASKVMNKFGLPSIASNEMLIWYDTAPFVRTIVTRQVVSQSYPLPHHTDVLQQTISYHVPSDKIESLTTFDESLIIDRIKGELTARSDREGLNYLALNLADKIIRNEITVHEARRLYEQIAQGYELGKNHPALTKLNFTPNEEDQSIQAQESKTRNED